MTMIVNASRAAGLEAVQAEAELAAAQRRVFPVRLLLTVMSAHRGLWLLAGVQAAAWAALGHLL